MSILLRCGCRVNPASFAAGYTRIVKSGSNRAFSFTPFFA
jgi:hypothetical protein